MLKQYLTKRYQVGDLIICPSCKTRSLKIYEVRNREHIKELINNDNSTKMNVCICKSTTSCKFNENNLGPLLLHSKVNEYFIEKLKEINKPEDLENLNIK